MTYDIVFLIFDNRGGVGSANFFEFQVDEKDKDGKISGKWLVVSS